LSATRIAPTSWSIRVCTCR